MVIWSPIANLKFYSHQYFQLYSSGSVAITVSRQVTIPNWHPADRLFNFNTFLACAVYPSFFTKSKSPALFLCLVCFIVHNTPIYFKCWPPPLLESEVMCITQWPFFVCESTNWGLIITVINNIEHTTKGAANQ